MTNRINNQIFFIRKCNLKKIKKGKIKEKTGINYIFVKPVFANVGKVWEADIQEYLII